MSWSQLESQAPDIAEFAKARLHNKVAYLATIRKNGAPRIHPFTPIIGEGHFFVFMEPTSPKGHDLRRNGQFAVHCTVTDTSGGSGEVIVTGRAEFVTNPEMRALAIMTAPYQPAERYILFEFNIDSVVTTEYKDGEAVRRRWDNMESKG